MDKLQRLYEQIEQAPAYSKEVEDFKLWALAMVKKAMGVQDKGEKKMTREEAIARIKDHMVVHKMNEPRAILISEALDMAIEALKAEPSVTPAISTSEDAVSREAVINAINANSVWENEYNLTSSRIKKAVETLPPVTPESKWVPVDYDRYPETYPKPFQEVWITDEYGEVQCQVYNGTRSIKAWMPYVIPKPYKEGENE